MGYHQCWPVSASDESRGRGKVHRYPTSREKRARYGAPGLREGTRQSFVEEVSRRLSIRPVDDPALADGHPHLAQHGPAVKGSVAGFGAGRCGTKDPFCFGIENDYVSAGTSHQAAAAAQVQETGWLGTEQRDQAAEGDLVLTMQQIEG